jgi:broad specificity phosphatase PhoE
LSRLFVFARHAHSLLNEERRVNGDPTRPVPLTERGREQARMLGLEVSAIPLERCICTRFGRTRETAEIALDGRGIPLEVEALLDDIDVGELEGKTLDDYRAWKVERTRDDSFPGGESLNDAARRYVRAFRRMLDGGTDCVLAVCHEIPIRYALNGAAGSRELDGPAHAIPNASPFLFDESALARACDRIEELAGPPALR